MSLLFCRSLKNKSLYANLTSLSRLGKLPRKKSGISFKDRKKIVTQKEKSGKSHFLSALRIDKRFFLDKKTTNGTFTIRYHIVCKSTLKVSFLLP